MKNFVYWTFSLYFMSKVSAKEGIRKLNFQTVKVYTKLQIVDKRGSTVPLLRENAASLLRSDQQIASQHPPKQSALPCRWCRRAILKTQASSRPLLCTPSLLPPRLGIFHLKRYLLLIYTRSIMSIARCLESP